MNSLKKPREILPITMDVASEADIPVLIDIEQSIQKSKVYTPMITEKAWKEEFDECTVYLIKSGGISVGSLAYQEKSPDHIYVSGVAIKSEYQGKGVATQAIQKLLNLYSHASRIDLVTHPDNPALRVYQSLGFKIEERKENYWGDGEPRLVLALARK